MIIFFYFSKLITILFEPKHLRFKPFYPTKEMSSISKFYYESSELDDKHGADQPGSGRDLRWKYDGQRSEDFEKLLKHAQRVLSFNKLSHTLGKKEGKPQPQNYGMKKSEKRAYVKDLQTWEAESLQAFELVRGLIEEGSLADGLARSQGAYKKKTAKNLLKVLKRYHFSRRQMQMHRLIQKLFEPIDKEKDILTSIVETAELMHSIEKIAKTEKEDHTLADSSDSESEENDNGEIFQSAENRDMSQFDEDEAEFSDEISTIENEQEPELPGQSTGHEEEEGGKIYPQNAKTTRKYHQKLSESILGSGKLPDLLINNIVFVKLAQDPRFKGIVNEFVLERMNLRKGDGHFAEQEIPALSELVDELSAYIKAKNWRPQQNSNRPQIHTTSTTDVKRETLPKSFFCTRHGSNVSHNTEDCRSLNNKKSKKYGNASGGKEKKRFRSGTNPTSHVTINEDPQLEIPENISWNMICADRGICSGEETNCGCVFKNSTPKKLNLESIDDHSQEGISELYLHEDNDYCDDSMSDLGLNPSEINDDLPSLVDDNSDDESCDDSHFEIDDKDTFDDLPPLVDDNSDDESCDDSHFEIDDKDTFDDLPSLVDDSDDEDHDDSHLEIDDEDLSDSDDHIPPSWMDELDFLLLERELFQCVIDHLNERITSEREMWQIKRPGYQNSAAALTPSLRDLAITSWREARARLSSIAREEYRRQRSETSSETYDKERLLSLSTNRLKSIDRSLFPMSFTLGKGTVKGSVQDEILVDSGANITIFNSAHRAKLVNLKPHKADITGSNGTTVNAITGKGHVAILGEKLAACYAPEMIRSVISVPQLLSSGKFKVVFAGTTCSIINVESKEEIHVQMSQDKLYKLPPETIELVFTSNVATVKDTNDLINWHNRLGHIAIERLKMILKSKAHVARGIKIDPKYLKDPIPLCQACAMSRPLRFQSKKTPESKSTIPGHCWHYDVSGPNETASLSGYKYLHVFVDEATGEIVVDHAKTKEASEVINVHKRFFDSTIAFYRAQGCNKNQIMGDNGELDYSTITKFWTSKGVTIFKTPPYHSAANGIAERAIRTVKEIARTLLNQSGRPEFFWDYATSHAAFLSNITPRIIDGRLINDAYQQRNGRIFNYNRLHIWGADCFVPQQLESKGYTPRNVKGIYLGNDGYTFIVFIPSQMKEILSGDAVFDDRVPPYPHTSKHIQDATAIDKLTEHLDSLQQHIYVDDRDTIYMRKRPEGSYTEAEFSYLIGMTHHASEINDVVIIKNIRRLKGYIVCDRYLLSDETKYLDSIYALDAVVLCAAPIIHLVRTKNTGVQSPNKQKYGGAFSRKRQMSQGISDTSNDRNQIVEGHEDDDDDEDKRRKRRNALDEMTKARRSDRLKEKISNHSEVSETRCSTPLPDLLCSFCESVCTDSDCTNPDCPLVQYIARTPPEQSRPDSPASPIFECNCGHPRRMDLPCDNPECPDYVGDHNHFHNTEPSSIKPHQEDDDKDDEGDTASSNYIGP